MSCDIETLIMYLGGDVQSIHLETPWSDISQIHTTIGHILGAKGYFGSPAVNDDGDSIYMGARNICVTEKAGTVFLEHDLRAHRAPRRKTALAESWSGRKNRPLMNQLKLMVAKHVRDSPAYARTKLLQWLPFLPPTVVEAIIESADESNNAPLKRVRVDEPHGDFKAQKKTLIKDIRKDLGALAPTQDTIDFMTTMHLMIHNRVP